MQQQDGAYGAVRRRAVAPFERGGNELSGTESGLREVEMGAMGGTGEMTGRDRTEEFGAVVRSLRRGAAAPLVAKSAPRPLAAYSEFMKSARLVGRNIAATYSKLEKLAALASKRSLFDDRPAEIQELTYIIKGDLGSLNKQIARLGDAPQGRRHVRSHSSNVVLALQSRLATVSADFKQVLEVRSENLKKQNSRRETFAGGLPAARGPAVFRDDPPDDAADDRPTRIQAVAFRDESDDYAAVRAETMQNIESTVVELGGIFQQLAHMVKEQDETVTRIDANVENAELNIEAAHSQILKYFQSVSGNRMLMLKIFGVLIFFFIFFAVFLA